MRLKAKLELLEKWVEWEKKVLVLALALEQEQEQEQEQKELDCCHHYRRSNRRSSTKRSWRSSRMHNLPSGRNSVPGLLLKHSQTAIGRRCRCRHLCR